MGTNVCHLGPGDVPLLKGMLALFGEAFSEPDTYGGAVPDDAYLAGLLAKRHFVALAALDGEADAADRRDPSLAYARAARAVRMCIALQSRLLGELPALERAERMAGLERRGARKRQIVHLVRTVAESEHADEIEQISGEAWERLNDTDEYSAVMNGSLREAVARICDDLDVTPDWSLWGGEFEAKDPFPRRGRSRRRPPPAGHPPGGAGRGGSGIGATPPTPPAGVRVKAPARSRYLPAAFFLAASSSAMILAPKAMAFSMATFWMFSGSL